MDTISRLDQLAAQHHTSVQSILQKSGLNHSTVATARRRGSQLSVPTIELICSALGITLKDFFDTE